MKLIKKMFNSTSAAVLSALTVSACCLPPLILLLFSIGSATAAAALAQYHLWFLGAGAVLLGISYAMYFRERRACSTASCRMKNRKLTVASLVFGTLVVGAFAANSIYPHLGLAEKTDANVARTAAKYPASQIAVIPIEGMTCITCEAHVEKVVAAIPGVASADASTANANAVVAFNPAQTSPAGLVHAINTQTGYTATLPESTPLTSESLPFKVSKVLVIPVEGMSCVACAARVKKTLTSIAGVGDVQVSLAERNARVRFDPSRLAPDQLVAAINGLGYQAGIPKEAPK
ncbi:MAG: copper ion binding protein [Candidatus Hydrogenedentes bacterium]|nr:copper ion binding protein [Candidatus Hydrogenedentota bacterium]